MALLTTGLKTRKGTELLNAALMLTVDNTHWHRPDLQVNQVPTIWSEYDTQRSIVLYVENLYKVYILQAI